MNISPHWTSEERLSLIHTLAVSGMERARAHYDHESFGFFERIRLLVYSTDAFLEKNREAMLEGVEPEIKQS